MGVIVARHQPRNPVGWILILFVVLFLIPVDAGYYAALRYRLGYHGLPLGPAAVVLTSLWPLAFALFPLVILLFPDGRLTSRRWRWVLRGYAVAVGYVVAFNLIPALAGKVGHDIQVNSSGDVTYTYHLAPVLGALNAVAYLSIGVTWLSFVGHQVLSWRRATRGAPPAAEVARLRRRRSPCASACWAARSARPSPPPACSRSA